MRRVWVVLALCGCNQIYGLEPTRDRDAAPEPSDRSVRLSMLVANITPTGAEAPPTLMTLPNTTVRFGGLDEELRAATYVPDATGGFVDYPFAFVNQRWRLEYTPPFDVPHELQWDPPVGAGWVVAPVIGRLERTVPPPDTGFTMSMKRADNTLVSFSPSTVVYTTGYWSATPSTSQTLTPSVKFTDATPLDGAPRSMPVAGDVMLAIDYVSDAPNSNCTVAKVSGDVKVPAVVAGALTPVELAIFMQPTTPMIALEGETAVDAQVRLAAAVPFVGVQAASRLRLARIASTAMPMFTTLVDGVPSPPAIPLFECEIPVVGFPAPNEAGNELTFTKSFVASIVHDRMAHGARLRSSIAFVAPLIGGSYAGSAQVSLATDIRIDGVPLTDDLVMGSARRDLAFKLEQPTGYVADYYEVILYRIENAALVPVRTYVGIDVANPGIRFDPAVMSAGPHVFAVRSYRGRPGARTGDFRGASPQQAVGTVFTGTFTR